MIFGRGKSRRAEADDVPVDNSDAAPDADDLETTADSADDTGLESETPKPETPDAEALDVDALDAGEWRDEGPWDIDEVEDLDSDADGPRIDLGAMVLTGVPGSELRLQVAEDTQQIVSAMLVIESTLPGPDGTGGQPVTSALELGAYAAPRSGGFWSELREEISDSAIEAGGSATLHEGPFGVELFRLFPVTTPNGEEGYQPSKMWVAEGPRWLLRGIVYGQAAIEESDDSPVVTDVVAAFRKVVVRRGDEPMAPGDLLPLNMPEGAVPAPGQG